ncbi:MAG: hypothetical protein XU15_C0011G0120 [candidate division NC10 bacterium CSP1-5]|nr:MAG: hypothetical protein XU15_C0011G0120 [candidate division NC10 bacterium CSP1-5]
MIKRMGLWSLDKVQSMLRRMLQIVIRWQAQLIEDTANPQIQVEPRSRGGLRSVRASGRFRRVVTRRHIDKRQRFL